MKTTITRAQVPFVQLSETEIVHVDEIHLANKLGSQWLCLHMRDGSIRQNFSTEDSTRIWDQLRMAANPPWLIHSEEGGVSK